MTEHERYKNKNWKRDWTRRAIRGGVKGGKREGWGGRGLVGGGGVGV